ncbi:MAG: hypothetical protein ACK4HE_11215 [Chitinophagaceae bacterium]
MRKSAFFCRTVVAITTLAIIFLNTLVANTAYAQLSNYTRSVLSAQSYTNISGATIINSDAGLSAGMSNNADDGVVLINLPFSFTFNGTAYTQVTMCTNGWIAMGNATNVATLNGRSATAFFSNQAPYNVIAAWYGNGNANYIAPGIGSLAHGAVSTNVYAFEWRNVSAQGNLSSATNTINFKIVIYGPASSTPGRIEILYGALSGTASGACAVGLKNATGG